MKLPVLFAAMALLVSQTLSAAVKEPSLISAYKGGYTGTLTLSGGGTLAAGSTTASFQASKKKETGTLTLTSSIALGNVSTILTNRLVLNKRQVQYFLGNQFTTIIGSGNASIKKRAITFTSAITAGGTASGVATGTIKLTKKGLLITQTVSADSQVIFLTYDLTANKKRK